MPLPEAVQRADVPFYPWPSKGKQQTDEEFEYQNFRREAEAGEVQVAFEAP